MNRNLTVDLGSGATCKAEIRVDAEPGVNPDILCNLGFDTIPIGESQVIHIRCFDVLEHIPHVVFDYDTGARKFPSMQLWSEIYRILQPGGTFEFQIPNRPHAGDTHNYEHVSTWTKELVEYIIKGPDKEKAMYHNCCRFSVVQLEQNATHIRGELRAEKP